MAIFRHCQSCIVAIMVSLGTMPIASTFPTPIPEEQAAANSSRLNTSDIPTTLFISGNNANFSVEVLNHEPAKTIHVRFILKFPTIQCCPMVHFFSNNEPNSTRLPSYVTRGCFNNSQMLYNQATLGKYFFVAGSPDHYSDCKVIGGEYVCTGERNFRSARSQSWFWAMGHKCGQERPLNVSLDIGVVSDRPVQCIPLDKSLKCGYDYTTFPNLLGHSNMGEARKYADIFLRLPAQCHQHYRQYSCRLIFPQCTVGESGTAEPEVIMPCRKMCEEMTTACGKVLKELYQGLNCEALKEDPDVCYHMEVTCPDPTPPEFGQVTVRGKYHKAMSHFTCKGGYTLQGYTSTNCTFAGTWNGTTPKCVLSDRPDSDRTKTALILSAAGVVSLAASFAIIMILRMKKPSHTKVNTEKRPPPPAPVMMTTEKKRNVFLAFSSEDRDIVNDTWVPVMHTRIPSWRVITHETGFLPGRRVTECIEEAIADSDVVVALLSKSYLDSDWCMLELSHAQVRARRDPCFKLVLVLHGVKEDELPDGISESKETWGVLYLSDPFFLEMLVKCLQA